MTIMNELIEKARKYVDQLESTCDSEDDREAIGKLNDILSELSDMAETLSPDDTPSTSYDDMADRVQDLLPSGASAADETAISSYIRTYGKEH